MALQTFLTAAQRAAQKYAGNYGLSPEQLYHALVMTAGLEGGLGEEAGIGDNGASFGRFQFNTRGGHGETLINQGIPLEVLRSDEFQADHWAPILGAALAEKLAEGYTGAEAVRQAAYQVERPAEIYPPDRVAAANAEAGRLTGAMVPGGGGGGGGYTDGSGEGIDDPLYKQLKELADGLARDWIAGGSDPDDPIYYDWQEAMARLADYMSVNGIDPRATGGSNEANDRISRWATIEGVNNDIASRAQDAWKSKNANALTAAQSEIDSKRGANLEQVELQEARNASSTPGLLPMPLGAGTFVPGWGDTLKKYRDRYGAGDNPEAGGFLNAPPSEAPPAAPTTGAPGQSFGKMPTEADFRSAQDAFFPNPFNETPQGRLRAESGIDPLPSLPPTDSIFGRTGTGRLGSLFGDTERTAKRPEKKDDEENLFEQLMRLNSLGVRNVVGAAGNPIGTAGKYAKKWGKRFFAEGGQNIPGGRGVVGEREPEVLWHPTFGMRIVGQEGPEEIDIPEGSSIIPGSEALRMRGIQKGMQPGAIDTGSPESRAADPDVQAKALASFQRAVAAAYAANPPATPIPRDGAPDYFAPWRQLSGVPYDPAQVTTPQQQGAR